MEWLKPVPMLRSGKFNSKYWQNARFNGQCFPDARRPSDLDANEDGQWSSPETTERYVAQFCRLNHLKG